MNVNLVMLEDGRRGRELLIRRPEVILGRAKGCKVRIASSEVSRQHCRLRVIGTTVDVQDLGSANGTFVNGTLCQGLHTVQPFDRLQIGPVTFLIEFDPLTQPMAAIPMSDEELTIEAEDIIIMDVEEVDAKRATQAPRPMKTRHVNPTPVRSDTEWGDQAPALPPTKPEEAIPWANLSESSPTPLPTPPSAVEHLPTAEPEE
jgi:hypothetical protein